MTDRPARNNVYSALMWPQWNPRTEAHGVGTADTANAMLDALDAEAIAPLMRIVNEWVVEANDIGGVDAGDLAWRLERAGYPLPNNETAARTTEDGR